MFPVNIMHPYVATYFGWLTLLTVAAGFCGRSPERRMSWMLTIASALTVAVRSGAATKYHNVEIGVAAVDLALFAGFVVVALRTERWWPLCAAAIQAITLTGHLAKMLIPDMSRMAYALMITLPSFPLLAVLSFGVVRQILRNADSTSRSS